MVVDKRLRDSSRLLAELRDAHVCQETLDSVIALAPSEIQQSVNAWLRSEVDSMQVADAAPADGRPADRDSENLRWINVRKIVRRCSKAIRKWQIPGDDFSPFHEGLRRTYQQARLTLRTAKQSNSAENWHEFRKYLKYHGTQIRLLVPICPPFLGAHRAVAFEVAEDLGRDHDLAMLAMLLDRLHGGIQGEAAREKRAQLKVIVSVISDQQALLRKKSSRLAAFLLAESPKSFVSRLDAYWDCWKQAKG